MRAGHGPYAHRSLRRYNPDQVRWVGKKPLSPQNRAPQRLLCGKLVQNIKRDKV